MKEVINEMGQLVRKKVTITVGDEFLAVSSGLEFVLEILIWRRKWGIYDP